MHDCVRPWLLPRSIRLEACSESKLWIIMKVIGDGGTNEWGEVRYCQEVTISSKRTQEQLERLRLLNRIQEISIPIGSQRSSAYVYVPWRGCG